jgi:hypothetical protein
MPTARELLDQADALMRRNRRRVSEPDIPELTDEVAAVAPQGTQVVARPVATARDEASDEVPELTDAVVGIEDVVMEGDAEQSDESLWLESELGAASITGPAPDSIAVVPPSTLRAAPPITPERDSSADQEMRSDANKPAPETAAALVASTLAEQAAPAQSPGDPAFDAMLGAPPADVATDAELGSSPALAEADGAVEESPSDAAEAVTIAAQPDSSVDADMEAALAAAPASSGSPAWDAVAEEIRMQVLQRIDIFTDTGLQGELAARLQPVVDRASADLVATINREVGQLLRAYVAEAIEREIARWRESNS